jgi:hypothetical protein
MDIRCTTAIRLSFILSAALATACSSSSSTGFGANDSGSPQQDGSMNMPGDAGGTGDSGNTPPPDGNTPQPDAPAPVDARGSAGDGGSEAGVYDFGCGGNTACPLTQVCCSMLGNPTTWACVNPGSCPSGDSISCDGPDECVGTSTPVCCGVAVGNGQGTYPSSCGGSALGTSCTTAGACATHVATSCSDTSTVQICHFNPDCTDTTYNQCCTFMVGGAPLTFCTDSTGALVSGHCHP